MEKSNDKKVNSSKMLRNRETTLRLLEGKFLKSDLKDDFWDLDEDFKRTKETEKNIDFFKITGHQEEISKDLKFEVGELNNLLNSMETRLNKNRKEVINIVKKS